ncbi:MAG TPA: hypothetical protein VNN73_22705 [Blastocatellia bacterium]|nr:hypothetical protein [Blastocatellia bacterium]
MISSRNLSSILSSFLSLIFFACAAFAQTNQQPEQQPKSKEAQPPSPPRYRSLRQDKNFYTKKLTDAQKRIIAPTPEDSARFAEFLKQDHTGLIRLLPKGKHEFSYTVSADDPEAVLPIRGGGAFYSFTEKTHSSGPWSEIALAEGYLATGFTFESLGMLVSLGDMPLEQVTLSTPGVEYLAGYTPPTNLKDAQAEREREADGFKVGSFSYSLFVPVAANTTYVMRSMIYKKQGRLVASVVPVYIRHPFEYEGADVLIAFRVVRLNPDGSVTLLWKRLKKFPAPKIKKRDK